MLPPPNRRKTCWRSLIGDSSSASGLVVVGGCCCWIVVSPAGLGFKMGFDLGGVSRVGSYLVSSPSLSPPPGLGFNMSFVLGGASRVGSEMVVVPSPSLSPPLIPENGAGFWLLSHLSGKYLFFFAQLYSPPWILWYFGAIIDCVDGVLR